MIVKLFDIEANVNTKSGEITVRLTPLFGDGSPIFGLDKDLPTAITRAFSYLLEHYDFTGVEPEIIAFLEGYRVTHVTH